MTTKLSGIDWLNKLDLANDPAGVAALEVAMDAAEARLDILDASWHTNVPVHVDFVIGAEGSNKILVSMQLKDGDGVDLAVRGSVFFYLSSDAAGDAIIGTAPSGGIAVKTDGLAIPLVAGKALQLISEADGDVDVELTEAGVYTCYANVVLPNGLLMTSGAITFA